LESDLGSLAKQLGLEDLVGKKNPSADDKKQIFNVRKQVTAMIDRRLKSRLTVLNSAVKKVERPENLDDKQSNVLDGQLKDLTDDSTPIELPDSVKKALNLKDITISVNLDDSGLIVGKTWRFGK
jgi:hypothetical protein